MEILERTTVGPHNEHLHKIQFVDHWERYEFAGQFVANKNVVDVASGPGYGTAYLSEQAGKTVLGLDVDQETVNAATHNYGHKANFKKIEGYNWDIEPNTVDVVVSLETFEHLDQPEAFLLAAKKVLKTNGKLILSTPINESEGRFKPVNPYHLREYTWNELGEIISKYFTIESRYSQVAKSGELSAKMNDSRFLKVIKNLIPTSVKALLLNTLNENMGYKKGTILKGEVAGASVQIIVAVSV
jgi:2-polyprenyl-3-methyl-5-hydroxy-6-metoxy-1,4-benzoquinol methylase